MFHLIYSSESNFYKGLLRGDWDFGSIFKKTLKLIEKDMKISKIYHALGVYSGNSVMDNSLHMFTIPIKNGKIDYEIINS